VVDLQETIHVFPPDLEAVLLGFGIGRLRRKQGKLPGLVGPGPQPFLLRHRQQREEAAVYLVAAAETFIGNLPEEILGAVIEAAAVDDLDAGVVLAESYPGELFRPFRLLVAAQSGQAVKELPGMLPGQGQAEDFF
jgi:hypothetical protein